MKRIVNFLLVFVLAVGLVAPVSAVATADGPVHIVEPGDTLWQIAIDHDTNWGVLAEYNELDNPRLIFPGQVIRIPVAKGAQPYLPVNEVTPTPPAEEAIDTPTFTSEEVIVGEGGRWPLSGTLTIPAYASPESPVPAVVLVQGSGASNRNLAMGPNQAFYDIAVYLSSHGIAVLRYDKRTYVHATELMQEYGTGFTVWEETIEDAILAAELLRADPRIDSSRIYMAGLSLGGMLAPRIHASGGDFAGLIIMAGSPRQLYELVADQERHLVEIGRQQLTYLDQALDLQLTELMILLATLDEADAMYEEVQAAINLLEDLIATPQDDIYNEAIEQLNQLEELIDEFHTAASAVTNMTAEEAQAAIIGAFTAYYLRDMALNPTPEILAEITVPMLILHGDNDFQVFTQADFMLFQELIGYRGNVAFRLYPGLNHIFMPSVAANLPESIVEMETVTANVYAPVLRDIVDWILSR